MNSTHQTICIVGNINNWNINNPIHNTQLKLFANQKNKYKNTQPKLQKLTLTWPISLKHPNHCHHPRPNSSGSVPRAILEVDFHLSNHFKLRRWEGSTLALRHFHTATINPHHHCCSLSTQLSVAMHLPWSLI